MNKQIVTLIVVVLLGIGAGVLIVSTQERKMAPGRQHDKAPLIQTMKELQISIDQLTAEIKSLKSMNITRQGNQAAAAQPQPPAEDYSTVHKIEAGHSPVLGKKDVPVTIVEFMDFQCPYCSRFHHPVEEIVKQYPDQVNYIIKNYPLGFHAQARPAAKAAFAAGEQGKYREMANLLLENQKNLSDETYKNLAQQLGLDVEKFWKDYTEKNSLWDEYINKDMELGSQVGVRGTPTFFINGQKTRSRTAEEYKKEIDAILKK